MACGVLNSSKINTGAANASFPGGTFGSRGCFSNSNRRLANLQIDVGRILRYLLNTVIQPETSDIQ